MRLTVGIPTYRREQVLIDTLLAIISLPSPADEIVVVDQSPGHEPATVKALEKLSVGGKIRWIRQGNPSIPVAMNRILFEARGDRVLFLDDDIVPQQGLVAAHLLAQSAGETVLVAGQVLQPGEEPIEDSAAGRFRFCSSRPQSIDEFMGGNFSVRRSAALSIGGFDENFSGAAYCFERDFADRWLDTGGTIWFCPAASIHHLKALDGGTRSYGSHLTSFSPAHSVGEYYYLLQSSRVRWRWWMVMRRLISSFLTRHHLRKPWWVPATVVAELRGLSQAIDLRRAGRKTLRLPSPGLNREGI